MTKCLKYAIILVKKDVKTKFGQFWPKTPTKEIKMPKLFISILSVLSLSLSACGDDLSGRCYQNSYQNVTNYEEVRADVMTPSGIRVDTGGYAVDLATLDARVAKIEACILRMAAESLVLPAEQKKSWQCLREVDPNQELMRDCLVIKVVAPTFSKCSDWQFIGVAAPDGLCLAKGITPTDECPCMWRTAIQDDNVVITPPAMYLWEVGRIMTSCNNIWFSPFAKCLGF